MRPLLCSVAALIMTAGQPTAPYHVERVADGVYAVIRHDPIGYGNNANSLVIVGDSAVTVVDAQFTRLATRQTIAAIRGISSKPVRYVINTHWHDDHVAGNQVYRDTFPNVEVVAQENTRRDLATIGAQNRKATVSGAAPFVARLERLIAAGLGADSTPITARERDALTCNVAIVRQYLTESANFRETLPTRTFNRALTLRDGKRAIELRWFGPANTEGDAVVFIPDARVVSTGDLVVHPVPFAFNAFVGGLVDALDSLLALHAAVYVPGHGPVLRDDEYVTRERSMLARIRDEARDAVAHHMPLDSARLTITLARDRQALAASDKWLNFLFSNFFLAPAVQRAYREATRSGLPPADPPALPAARE